MIFLDGMARGQIGGLEKYAKVVMETADLETIYYTFSGLTKRKVNNELLSSLYGIARERHGEIVDLFRRVCEEQRRTGIISSMRSKVVHPERRSLLALLMLMPDRDAIFETIRLQFPEDEPLTAIERLLEGMSGKETIGFKFDDVNRLLFRGLVEGLGEEELLQRLRSEFDDKSLEANRDRLSGHMKKLAMSELLRPLLSGSPLYREGIAM
jgi:hypothetical protein